MRITFQRTKTVMLSSLLAFTTAIGGFAVAVSDAHAAEVVWKTVVSPGFSDGKAFYSDIMFDPYGIPYVGFMDEANNNSLTVMRLIAGNWEVVGTKGFTGGLAHRASFALDSTGAPYAAFMDAKNGFKVTVMKFDASTNTWVTVGAPGFAGYGTNVIDLSLHGTTPYVAFSDSVVDYRASVMMFDDQDQMWKTLGSSGVSTDPVNYVSLASGSTGKMYLSYGEFSAQNGANVRVKTYSENEGWTQVGSQNFQGDSTELALDSQDNLYVSYSSLESAKPFEARVMRYDESGGVWESVGASSLEGGRAQQPVIAFDEKDELYMAYADNENSGGGKATVLHYEDGIWLPVGSKQFTNGQAGYAQIAFDSTEKPYIAFADGSLNNKITVMTTAPASPITDLDAVPGDGTVELSFSAPTGASKVTVEQSVYGSGAWSDADVGTIPVTDVSTLASVRNLQNGMKYDFRLRVDGGQYQGTSNVATAMPSDPIKDLYASPGNGEVTLWFSAPSASTEAWVELSSDGGINWARVQTKEPVGEGSWEAVVKDLVNGTAYQFRLNVKDGHRAGVSNVSSATPVAAELKSTLTMVTSSMNPSKKGEKIKFEVETFTNHGLDNPTGTVTLMDGDTVLDTITLNAREAMYGYAVGYYETDKLSAGSHSITAQYSGDSMFASGTSTAYVQVVTAPTDGSDNSSGGNSGENSGGGSNSSGGSAPTPVQTPVPVQNPVPVVVPTVPPTAPVQETKPEIGPSSEPQQDPNDIFQSKVVQTDNNMITGIQRRVSDVLATGSSPVDYGDVTRHWAASSIEKLTLIGVIGGYPDGNFKPDASITRAEFAAMVYRAFVEMSGRPDGVVTTNEAAFKDIEGHWASVYLKELVKSGVMSGYGDGTIRPNTNISREEMALMITRVLNENALDIDTSNVTFNDLGQVYGADAIKKAAALGIFDGKSQLVFDPRSGATRAEAIQTLLNTYNLSPAIKAALNELIK